MDLFSTQKEKLLLEYIISSTDTFSLCQPILRVDYFDPTLQKAVKFILEYYNQYHSIASPQQIKAETGTSLEVHTLTHDQIEYSITEIERFCRAAAIQGAIYNSVKHYQNQDYGSIETEIREAITTSIHRQAGTGLFENAEDLLQRLEQQPAIPTHYTEFDQILGGGLRRKEMLLFSANSGGGKSIVMANFGLNLLLYSNMRVLYLSFELPVEMIAKRYFSMVSGIDQKEIIERQSEIGHKVKMIRQNIQSDLVIEKLPVGTTPNEIRAFLREYELRRGHVPDVLILDYLDLMNPNEKVSADNISEKDKRVSEQMHQILSDYNMIGITASQQNRSAVTTHELNHSHIAGGITKINTTDIYASIIFNAALQAAGEIHIEFLKTRSSDGVGKRVELRWNGRALRIEDPSSRSTTLTLNKKSLDNNKSSSSNQVVNEHSSKLTDLIDI